MVKNLPANAGDMGLIPGLGRSHGVENECSLFDSLFLIDPQDSSSFLNPLLLARSLVI